MKISTLLAIIVVLNSDICYPQDSIRTDVFSLSTCDPSDFSLVKNRGSNPSSKDYINKLEARSRRPTVLRISGINPLRYRYYINNEAVTQFMESSSITLPINSFVNGEYLISAPEIKVPEIFKTDSISTQVKGKIRDLGSKLIQLREEIEETDNRLREFWDSCYSVMSGDSTAKTNRILTHPDYRKIYNRQGKTREQYDRTFREYEIYTRGLAINNPNFAILEQYFKIDTNTSDFDPKIKEIMQFQKEFAATYKIHAACFKVIDSLLFDVKYRISSSDARAALRPLLEKYNFSWLDPDYYFSYYYFSANQSDYINEIKEQVLNKRFQLYEEFVMNLAARIGVLVQNQFREYSSYNNALERFSCIDDLTLNEVRQRAKRLTSTFDFIQKTSAELQIMVSYLDINTDLYQNIAKKINTNYIYLLSYLKNLNFVSEETSKQYTLPTHTNLKNIDLVRYTVKREDKVTSNTQTYNYDFWIKGGIKIDFSFGFFGSGLRDNTYNKVLLDTIGGIDKIRITRQDDGRTDFAFGGMVNLVRRNGASWVNWGGSIGVAYSGNQKLQVLTGMAFHFGKTERLIVHGGAAFGMIKALDISANDFKFFDQDLKPVSREKIGKVKDKDRVYMLESPDVKFSSYAIPTAERFVVRPFIGISYNLSKKNALQAVSGTAVRSFSDNYNSAVTY